MKIAVISDIHGNMRRFESIMKQIELYSAPISEEDYNITELKNTLKNLMWDNVGIIRCEKDLLEAQRALKIMMNNFKRDNKCFNKEEYEYRNMLTVANLIIESAINRKESRGAHSRSDYKLISNNIVHTTLMKTKEEELIYA